MKSNSKSFRTAIFGFVVLAFATLSLSACAVYEEGPYRGGGYGWHDHDRGHDFDRDGARHWR